MPYSKRIGHFRRVVDNPVFACWIALFLLSGFCGPKPAVGQQNQGPHLHMMLTLKHYSGILTNHYKCDNFNGEVKYELCGYELKVEAFSDGLSLGTVAFDRDVYKDEIAFKQNQQERGYKNPIKFQINRHPSQRISVNITMQYYSESEASLSQVFAGGPTRMPMVAIDDMEEVRLSSGSHSSLVFSIQLFCNPNFYGQKCDRHCKANNSEQVCDTEGALKCKQTGTEPPCDVTATASTLASTKTTIAPTSTPPTTSTSKATTTFKSTTVTSSTSSSTRIGIVVDSTTPTPPSDLIMALAGIGALLLLATAIGFSVCLGIRCASRTAGKQRQQQPPQGPHGTGQSSAGSVSSSHGGSTLRGPRNPPPHLNPVFKPIVHAGADQYGDELFYDGRYQTSGGLVVLTPAPRATPLSIYKVPGGGSGSGSCIDSTGTFAAACDIPDDTPRCLLGRQPDGQEEPPETVSPGAGYPLSVALPGTHYQQGTLPSYWPPAPFESSTVQRGKPTVVAVRSFQV